MEDEPAEPRLAAVPARLRPVLTGVWLIWFLLALAAQGLGIWFAASELEPFDLLALNGTGLISAAILFVAAALLVRRNPGDPVAFLLSFSFLSAASYVGATPYTYGWLGADFLGTLLPALWLGFLVAALPVFPDGRFVPRWSRWLTLLAVPFTLAISADVFFDNEAVVLTTTLVGFAIGITAVAASVIRFLRTPRGLERQQLKWASLGFAVGMLLLICSVLVIYAAEAEFFPEEWLEWLGIVYFALHDFGFAFAALGFLIAQLRLRLWDADRAIGRSLAYFLLSLILACVWAASATLVNDFVSASVGGGKGLSAALSTIVAALVFGPARERVNKWVDRHLRRGVMQLRRLPDRLAVWQSLDDSAAFGRRVALAVSDGLHAPQVAVLLFEDDAFRVLATEGIEAADVDVWIGERGSFADLEAEDRHDATFPLRLILTDEEVLIGAILVGRRSDGSAHAREERDTLFGLEPALAAALHRVQRRTRNDRAFDALDQRVAQVEAKVGAQPR